MGLMRRSIANRQIQKPLSQQINIIRSDILERIKQIPIFAETGKDRQAIDQIVDITRATHAPKNTIIIEEGSLGSTMYILHSGEVEIRKVTRAGDRYTVANLNADLNVFFGELALIDNDRRSASVITLSDCILLQITKKDFDELGQKSPQIILPIIQSIARILSKRLRKTTSDMLTIFDALVQELSE